MLEHFYLRSASARPVLRLGLLLDGLSLERSFATVLDSLCQAEFLRLEVAILPAGVATPPPSPRERSLLAKVVRRLGDARLRRRLLFDLYRRLERRRIPPDSDPLWLVDCSARLAGVERMRVEVQQRGFRQRFPEEAVVQIRARNLDVLLRFGFGILEGPILTAARFGIWSYHHGDNELYRGGPPCFWELVEKDPLTGVTLQVLTEELDGGLVLAKGRFATESGWSLARNQRRAYWASTYFMIQKLHELHREGWPTLQARLAAPVAYRGKRKIYRAPSNTEMGLWLVPAVVRSLGGRAKGGGRLVSHWRIGLRRGRRPLALAAEEATLQGFRWLEAPPGRSRADPFLLGRDQRLFCFFEEYVHEQGRAFLGCAPVLLDGTLGPAEPILQKPYHLSYPMVFEDEGEAYLIPESLANRTVDLYRAKRFPSEWEHVRTLFQGDCVDTTIHRQDGRYWFFTSVYDPRGGGLALVLFSAASLTGEWVYHPANPLSADERNIRGAGAIFWEGGRLIRPTQDGSGGYGGSFHFYEVSTLNALEYGENRLRTVRADEADGLVGTHTYNRLGDVEVTDAKVRIPAPRHPVPSGADPRGGRAGV